MIRLYWILLTVQSAWAAQSFSRFQPYHVSQKSVITFAPQVADHAYFGYSSSSFMSGHKLRVVVSAPREGRVGKLFNCDIDTGNCTTISDPDYLVTQAEDIKRQAKYKYHHFWLGAIVKGNHETFYTCAPLSVRTTVPETTKASGSFYATYGQCFKYNNESKKLTQLYEIKTDERTESGVFTSLEQCMDSFGWNMDISRYGKILVGGPAMTAGRVMSYSADNMLKTTPNLLIKTKELHKRKVKFNFGYSVVYGNFLSDSPVDDSAVSSPYGEIGVGKVLLFRGNRVQRKVIEDPSGQVGSLFGAALCAARLNSTSKRAHLLVGSPGFANNKSLSEYNRGAVHVYVPSKGYSLSKYRTILGSVDGGFFGSAITNVGDLDGDGSDDVAIAAPFEGSVNGAVYIYLGSKLMQPNGEVLPNQRIHREEYRAFGLSLSALNDYDSNGCKELVIGAPGSMVQGKDQVAVVRCMAWISLQLRNDFSKLQNRVSENYFDFESCMDVTYPEKLSNVNTTIVVSVNIIHPNATLEGGESILTYEVPITKKEPVFCKTIRVLTPVNGEYDKKIGIQVTANQTENPFYKEDFDPSYVVLCDTSILHVYENKFVGNCLSEKCVPNLDAKLISELFAIEPYVIGSTDSESFRIKVNNTGDVAYSACVVVSVLGVSIKSMPRYCEDDCKGQTNCRRVRCRPLSRLPPNQTWEIDDIVLETSTLNSADSSISVTVYVRDDCSNISDTNVTDLKTVQLLSNVSGVFVYGQTSRGEVMKISKSEAENSGAYFEHLYKVQNIGPTNLAEVKYKLSVKKIENYQYLAPKVRIDSKPIDCEPQSKHEDDMFVAFCEIDELKKGNQLDFLLPIEISPGTWFDVLKEKDIVIESQLHLFINSSLYMTWNSSVSTTLKKREGGVPWWIILLAVIIGLILVGIVVYLLHESGHLKRKNKANLKELKREIRRQSVRRSIRESVTKKESNDVSKLCDSKEQTEVENEIDIQEVQNDGFAVDQQPEQNVIEVHAERGRKGAEYTSM